MERVYVHPRESHTLTCARDILSRPEAALGLEEEQRLDPAKELRLDA